MRDGSTPRTGSAAAVSARSTSCHPTSGARAGPTRAPAARATSWAPRQTPRTGIPAPRADWMNEVSPASHSCSASSSGCITPPKTMIASHAPGSPGGASPFAVNQRSRWSPRSTTTRSNSPPPPVGESSWTTDRTRMWPTLAMLEQRQLGRRGLDAACRRDARLVEQPTQDLGAPGGEVVAVVVEERVDLLGLACQSRERLDPLRELVRAVQPVEALG